MLARPPLPVVLEPPNHIRDTLLSYVGCGPRSVFPSLQNSRLLTPHTLVLAQLCKALYFFPAAVRKAPIVRGQRMHGH
jgi:hypothetical protein